MGLGDKPKVIPPTRMPDPEDPQEIEARRRRVEAMRTRGGRASTIMGENMPQLNQNLG